MFTRRLISAILFALAILPIVAQQPAGYDRERYISEVRNYKHEFIARELDIPHEHQQAFFEMYDAMEDEEMQLNQDIRELEQQVISNAEASDVEVEAAAAAVFLQKQKETEIETRYFERFSEVLTPHQLLRLKSVERRFNQQLMRQHRRRNAPRQ